MYSTACPGSASRGFDDKSRLYILEPCLGALRDQRHPAVSIDSSFDTRLGLRMVLRQVSSNFLAFVFSRDSCAFLPLCCVLPESWDYRLSLKRSAL